MLVDLVQLRTFIAVAEEQHLTRAAERLHISQSAASAHVRAIESYLDTRLFIRTNRNLELTKAGLLMLRHAKTLMNEAAQFTSVAREVRGRMEGSLVVGSGSEPDTRIGEIVGALRRSHPLVTVDSRMRPSLSSQQGLRSGELDISILLGRPIDAAFTYYELGKVRLRVAGPVAWRERIESADWVQLADLPWISPSSNSTAYSSMLDELFVQRGLKLNVVALWDTAVHGRAMLNAGVGVMLVRAEHAEEGAREGRLAISPLVAIEYSMSVAHQRSRKDDPLIKAFVDAAAEVWHDLKIISDRGSAGA